MTILLLLFISALRPTYLLRARQGARLPSPVYPSLLAYAFFLVQLLSSCLVHLVTLRMAVHATAHKGLLSEHIVLPVMLRLF